MGKSGKINKKWLLIAIMLVLTAVVVIAGIVIGKYIDAHYFLTVDLIGEADITLAFGENYTEQGAKASFYSTLFEKEPVSPEVTIEGEVNEKVLGTYKLTYRARHGAYAGEAYRTVHVVDEEAPVITLVNAPGNFTLPGQAYQEEGFSATDNYDGDITAAVECTEKDGIVLYKVSDSSGNTTTVTRKIVYNDPVPPELILLGDAEITINAGDAFEDPGCTASDNCDGDLTDKVVVSGDLDVYIPGTYEVVYTAVDSYGNEATVTRTVVVKQVNIDIPVTPTGKVVYLTFDDGPGPYTDRLLDVLKKYNVKATFFLVNTGSIGIAKRIAQEGHAVAIHTTTHDFSEIYASEEAFFNDLYTMQDIIYQHTGVKTMLMRFPGGSSNTVSRSYCKGIMTRLTQAVEAQGFRYFDWNVDSNDAGGASTADQVFENVTSGIKGMNKAVVLQHDIKSFSVDAVERIIVWGLENGYSFKPLDAGSPGCHHGVNN